MEPSQAFSEIVELVTNNWIAPFIHPERFADNYASVMDGSREERNAAGYYTDDELRQTRESFKDAYDEGRLTREDFERSNRELNASIKGLTSDRTSVIDASDFPNLTIVGGMSELSGRNESLLATGGDTRLTKDAHFPSLRKVGGDLEIKTDRPTLLNMLNEVKGSVRNFVSAITPKLSKIGGRCELVEGEFDAPNLVQLGKEGIKEFAGTLSEKTKDAVRRMKSSKVYQDLSRSEAQGVSQGIKMK